MIKPFSGLNTYFTLQPLACVLNAGQWNRGKLNYPVSTGASIPLLKFLIWMVMAGLSFSSFGQNFPMTNGSVDACSGTFLDDGGANSPYSLSSYTFTICPDTPGNAVQVDFTAFGLWENDGFNSNDALTIHDGPNPVDPSLGTFSGNDLQGLSITATSDNPTGCLTFVFVPNPNSGGAAGWEAEISCTDACAIPTAVAEVTDPEPSGGLEVVETCMGDEISFSGAGSFAEAGNTLETYIWDFGDGIIDNTSGQEATHTFDEPGEYFVTLMVVDSDGCLSIPADPWQILVSTEAIFNTAFDSEICLGESATLDGSAVQSDIWTSIPPQVFSGETYLSDNQDDIFANTLTFNFFETGATLESCDDFIDVFLNIEHSYIGDLEIQLSCPDGTTVPILIYPNGGGATYFGEPVDPIGGSTTVGIGYTYSWSPDATNGNVDDQPVNTVNFIDQDGNNVSNDIVPEGTYQPDGDLCNFVGCPLNGDWTLTVTDNIFLDDGTIFAWGINFDASLFPDETIIAPPIGLDNDSTFWSGPNLGDVSADGNVVEFTPLDTGSFDFTFTAINSFGCLQDTTVTIDVVPGPEAEAGEDLIVCTDSLQLDGSVVGVPLPPPTCEYTLEMFDSWGDGWNNFFVEILQDGVLMGTYTLTTGQSEGTATITLNHGADIQLNFLDNNGDGAFIYEISYNLINGAGDVVFSDGFNDDPQYGENVWNGTVDCQPDQPEYVFEWSPVDGLSNPHIADPMVLVDETTVYTLTVYDEAHPLCATTDEVTVEFIPNLNPGEDATIQVCYFDEPFDLNGNLGGDPTPGGIWTDDNGDIVQPETFDPADLPNGGSAVFTYTVGEGNCQFSSELTVEVQTSAENPDCCITNAVVGEGFEICELTAPLSAEEPLGTGTWTSDLPGAVFADASDPNTTVTVPVGGLYTFTFTDNNGVNCSASDAMTVHFSPEIIIEFVSSDNPSCAGACNGSVSFNVSGGIPPLSYDWSGGIADPNSPGSASGFCGEEFSLIISDAIGCADSTTFELENPPPPPVEAVATSPNCFGECSGSIEIISENGALYTFDVLEGTYTPEPVLDSVCAGTYHVGMIDVFGCANTTIVEVEDPAPVVANFEYRPQPVTILDAVVHFTDQSTPAPMDSVSWTFGLETLFVESSDPNPVFEFPFDSAGVYEVMLIAVNENGCIDTTIQNIHVEEEFLLYIPNSFTPNEDGMNDVWKPQGNNVHPDMYRLQIFDRYGELVFETRSFEEGWNGDIDKGSFYGQNEVYIYNIEAASATTLEKQEYTGHVKLIR